MKNLLFACAAACIFLAWLLPIHYRPWATYTGELYAFFCLICPGRRISEAEAAAA
jgi:hypothetical protein